MSSQTRWQTAWLITVVCLALALVVASMAALNTALPEIAPEIGATSNQMTWLIDGYTLTLAALLLPAGAIGDRFGRRGILIAGLIVFAVASVLPVWITDPNLIIVTRCLAGAAAAFIMPATLSLISSGVPTSKRPLAVAIWSGVAGAGAIIGFFITGLLLEFFAWHSIFITFSVTAAVIALLSFTIGSSKDPHPKRFDLLGSITVPVAVALFVYGLVEAPHRGWNNPLVIVMLVLGVVLGALFVLIELRVTDPLLDVRLFGNRAFSAGALSVLLSFLASFGGFYVLLQDLQLVFGYSALKSAFALVPMVATVMVFSLLSNWFAVRFSLRTALALGTFLMGLGLVLIGTVDYTTYWPLMGILVVVAIGIGIAAAPSTTAIMVNTPERSHGVGSAVNDTARELGAAVGIAIAGSIVAAGYTSRAHATTDLAEQGLHRQAQAAAAAGNQDAASQIESLIPGVGEHIHRSFAEAVQVAHQISARLPGPLGHEIFVSAQNAFIEPMNQACITLGSIVIFSGAVLAVLTPDRVDASRRVTHQHGEPADPESPDADSPDAVGSDTDR